LVFKTINEIPRLIETREASYNVQIYGEIYGEIVRRRHNIRYEPSETPKYTNSVSDNPGFEVVTSMNHPHSSWGIYFGAKDCGKYQEPSWRFCTQDFKDSLNPPNEDLAMVKLMYHWNDSNEKFFLLLENVPRTKYILREYTMKYYKQSDIDLGNPNNDKSDYDRIEPSDNAFNIEFPTDFYGTLRGAEIVYDTKLLVFYFKKFSPDGSTYQNRLCWIRYGRIQYLLDTRNEITF
jgi:hypothetical protein